MQTNLNVIKPILETVVTENYKIILFQNNNNINDLRHFASRDQDLERDAINFLLSIKKFDYLTQDCHLSLCLRNVLFEDVINISCVSKSSFSAREIKD